jgi:hypothetical protein
MKSEQESVLSAVLQLFTLILAAIAGVALGIMVVYGLMKL